MGSKFSNPLRALKSQNFLIYWVGLGISQTGTWMQNIAQPWLALQVTNNAALVGVVIAARFAPILFLSLFSGPLIDKMNKKTILFVTQGGLCVVSLLFALGVIFEFASFSVILILSLAMGFFNALDSPCRQSIIRELVMSEDEVSNAIALNSMSVSVSRILGPSLAGLIIAEFGLAVCFLANTLSFIAIFLSLFLIKPMPLKRVNSNSSMLNSIFKGLIYVKTHEILLSPLVILLIIGTLIPNYSVTVSALVKFTLGGSEKDFGYLMAMLGFGAFFGAFWIALRSKVRYETLEFTPFISASFLLLVGLSGGFWSTAICLIFTAFTFLICISTINSLLQLHSRQEYRGRVMSLYTLCFLGSTPFGAGLSGWISNNFGADTSFVICAILTYILLGAWFWIKKYLLEFRVNSYK